MINLVTAMRIVFPTLPEDKLIPSLRLSDCPNWDSMTAVNLLMEVEAACGVKMDDFQPNDGTTLEELATAIVAAGGTL